MSGKRAERHHEGGAGSRMGRYEGKEKASTQSC